MKDYQFIIVLNDSAYQHKEYAEPDAVTSRDTPTGLPQDIRNALVQYFQDH